MTKFPNFLMKNTVVLHSKCRTLAPCSLLEPGTWTVGEMNHNTHAYIISYMYIWITLRKYWQRVGLCKFALLSFSVVRWRNFAQSKPSYLAIKASSNMTSSRIMPTKKWRYDLPKKHTLDPRSLWRSMSPNYWYQKWNVLACWPYICAVFPWWSRRSTILMVEMVCSVDPQMLNKCGINVD